MQERAETVEDIKGDTGFVRIEEWPIELNDSSSVKAFVKRFEEDGGQLDIFLANAGVALETYSPTADGWDMSIQVNHLFNALLSFLLILHLVRTAKATSSMSRLIIVASAVLQYTHFGRERIPGDKILETLNNKAFCTEDELRARYYDSKLLNILFTRAPATHIPTSMPSVTPGICHSGLLRTIGNAHQAKVVTRKVDEFYGQRREGAERVGDE